MTNQKMNSESLWERAGIPALEYCKLDRAAELLNCKIDDLLHWGEIGLIDICFKFKDETMLLIPSEEYKGKRYTIAEKFHEKLFLASDNDLFNPTALVFLLPRYANTKAAIDDFCKEEGGLPFRVYGFLALSFSYVEDLIKYGSIKLGDPYKNFYLPDGGDKRTLILFTSHGFGEEVEFFINDAVVTRKSMDMLYSFRGKVIPSFISDFNISSSDRINEKVKVHGNTERHAVNKLDFLNAAINILSKYPDECRGLKKEISPEKWRDCIFSHQKEMPPLQITNPKVILEHLRKAVNGPISPK